MENIERRIKGVARVVALIGFFGLLLLAAMTTVDILLRWLFNAPLHGVNDVSSVVMAIVIAACIPANLAMKQNISVEVLGSIGGTRTRRVLDVVASLFTLVFIILMAWRFVPYAEGLRETGDRTWVLGWPIWPWWMAASVLMIAAAIVQVLVTISDIATLILGGPDEAEPSEPTGGDAIL
ncbi:TRAP transporter small permease [Neoaquamicrobium sediminum]|uniref:TRAP transporter small permease n=1 Tax=Neoaquamicrobium sediminum TaxID=1849104 RepID=UPI0019D61EAC|nr:TRAP transporter small permease [Mesorhizobium sediminum]